MKYRSLGAAVVLCFAVAAFAQEPVWDANTVVLKSDRLADGTFAVVQTGAEQKAASGLRIATSSEFVIGKNAVLVIDTMLNKRLHQQLMQLVKAETSLPVWYAASTSYYGDHSCANQYLDDETLVIQHSVAARYVAEQLDSDKKYMMQNYGPGCSIEQITATPPHILVDDRSQIRIDLGGICVTIREYGFGQTGGDLFVSVPSANVPSTGNSVMAAAPALSWLLDGDVIETRDKLKAVAADFDSNTRVFPGHGPIAGIEAINRHIDYRNALKREVNTAIARGLSLGQTVARVQLPDSGLCTAWLSSSRPQCARCVYRTEVKSCTTATS